jgi:hypothetical protein
METVNGSTKYVLKNPSPFPSAAEHAESKIVVNAKSSTTVKEVLFFIFPPKNV